MLLFEIGTKEALEIPCALVDFLNVEIPLYADECLALSFFHGWMGQKKRAFPWTKQRKRSLPYGRCAGYRILLFLGGEDGAANLEESDMEVYWAVLTQVGQNRTRQKRRRIPGILRLGRWRGSFNWKTDAALCYTYNRIWKGGRTHAN